ncbi:MAG: isoprenylcysteine carboxylmethyltransferase family protein [Hyphomicrobiales bacterium]|nr:MAG: isoprenylcysteine carboxylmethyltransferase family protein [Hyphomicrobiales bacterium]
MSNLIFRAWRAHFLMLGIMAALLFGPASSFDYWEGWVFLALFVSSSLFVSLYLAKKDPRLLERRLSIGPLAEQHTGQKVIMLCILAGSIGLVLVGSLDHRMAWSSLPASLVLAGDALVALGWMIFLKVFSENSFASATVELAPDQKVVATGPYAHVRHPMYAGAFIMLIGVPLALGSWWALLISAAMMSTLVWRLLAEERFLSAHLPGYCDYQAKVPDRLIPKIW